MRSMANTDTATPALLSFPVDGNAIVLGVSGGIGTAISDSIYRSKRFIRVLGFSRASMPTIELTDEASMARYRACQPVPGLRSKRDWACAHHEALSSAVAAFGQSAVRDTLGESGQHRRQPSWRMVQLQSFQGRLESARADGRHRVEATKA